MAEGTAGIQIQDPFKPTQRFNPALARQGWSGAGPISSRSSRAEGIPLQRPNAQRRGNKSLPTTRNGHLHPNRQQIGTNTTSPIGGAPISAGTTYNVLVGQNPPTSLTAGSLGVSDQSSLTGSVGINAPGTPAATTGNNTGIILGAIGLGILVLL